MLHNEITCAWGAWRAHIQGMQSISAVSRAAGVTSEEGGVTLNKHNYTGARWKPDDHGHWQHAGVT